MNILPIDRHMRPSGKLAISGLVLSFCTFCASVEAAPLKFCYEDVPQHPWTMPDGTGLNFELLRRVEKMLGEEFVFKPMPWKRCQEEVHGGEMDGIIGAADTSERRQYLRFPTSQDGTLDTSATLYEDQFNVYLREGGDGKWNGKNLTSPTRPVIVQSGYLVISTMLHEQGVKTFDSIKTAEDGLRFLSEGMVDVAVLQSVEAEYLRREDPRFKNGILLAATPFAVLPLYLGINRASYERDPKRIDAIWNQIRTVRNSSEYRKVVDSACRDKSNLHCGN
jgi:polar amino acid transport system substrate-binding protein